MLGKKKKKAEAEKKTKREILKEELAPEVKETKKPTVKKPRADANPDRVAALITHINEPLIIRSNPTLKQVKEFVKEQNRRYEAGEPGGPSGLMAFHIHEAYWYPSELDIGDPEKATRIKLDV